MRSRRGCRTGRRTAKETVFVAVRRGSGAPAEHSCSLVTAAELFQGGRIPGGRLSGRDEPVLLLERCNESLYVILPSLEGRALAEDQNEGIQSLILHVDRQAHFVCDRGVRYVFNVPDVYSTLEAQDTFLLTSASTIEGAGVADTSV